MEQPPTIDIREHGAGEQAMDRRLFVQLLCFTARGDHKPSACAERLKASLIENNIGGAIYADVNDPRGFGLVTFSEDPAHFVKNVRPVLDERDDLILRPEMTMLGRTYSSGYERDLEHWILKRPITTMTNPEWPWAVWYPLRRKGAFEQLEGREKGGILREHATIGRAYGEQDLAHDVRLACHGLDTNDNEFVIGLVGKDLHPLSHVVQTMRKTRQTAEYISQMGPFFIGHAIWQSGGN